MTSSEMFPGGSGHETGECRFFNGGITTPRVIVGRTRALVRAFGSGLFFLLVYPVYRQELQSRPTPVILCALCV
jgi:hypothetical protein